jgi:ribulose 1,5-bisphosphate synthetase/thiazole synthase
MGSGARVMLWDLELACGGGPGGGGGNGIPGSHLVVDEPRDLDDVGVPIAPAEAALREAGGLGSGSSVRIGSMDI